MITPLPPVGKALLLAALALRLAAAAHYYAVPLSPGGDDHQYVEIAAHLAAGEGYQLHGEPTAYRAPLYPLFLAALRRSGLGSNGAARAALAVWSTACVFLAFQLGGLAAMALTAFDPAQILLPTSLYSEAFYGVLVLAVAWALAAWRARRDDASAVRLGLAVGLSALCRSTLLLVPFIGLAFAKARPKAYALAAAAMALVLSPWALRNALVFHRTIVGESGIVGPILYYGSEGRVNAPAEEDSVEPMRAMYRTLSPLDWDAASLKLARANVIAHPRRYLSSTLRRVWSFWSDSYLCYLVYYHPAHADAMLAHWDALALACKVAFGGVCLLAAAGIGRGPAVWAALFLIGYANLYALGVVFPRYNAPFEPLVYVAAAAGVGRLRERLAA